MNSDKNNKNRMSNDMHGSVPDQIKSGTHNNISYMTCYNVSVSSVVEMGRYLTVSYAVLQAVPAAFYCSCRSFTTSK